MKLVPSISVNYEQKGSSAKSNELGMRPMQERVFQKRGEQYLLIKSPPASGKSRALMFVALDKLQNQGLKQAIIIVPEKSIGSSFQNEPLSQFGFWADWTVEPRWNLCNAPGGDEGKVNAVKKFLDAAPGAPTPSLAMLSPTSKSFRPHWHSRGYLPHHEDLDKIQHITFRLADSLPKEKLEGLKKSIAHLPIEQQDRLKRERIEALLDAGMGCCALGHPQVAALVTECLLAKDGQDYQLLNWCIMPNHVHVLILPKQKLGKIVQAWKSVTARKILSLKSELQLEIPSEKTVWQRDYWDRYIRDPEHLRACENYIEANPVKAGLVKNAADWRWSSASNVGRGAVGSGANGGVHGSRVLVCTHATFRFAVDKFGVEAFDERLLAIDEFHHVSANPDNKLGAHLGELMTRDKAHIVAMTGSYFRGDAEAVLHPDDEAKFQSVTYTYYEQLNGYEYLKQLDIGYYFYSGRYSDEILAVLNPNEKTIVHIPNVNSRESTKDKIREVEHILEELGDWQGTDPATGFQLVKTPEGKILKIADLVDDDSSKRDRVSAALKNPTQKHNRDHVDIIIALGMAKEGFDWIWCEHALTVGYRSSLTEIVQIIGRATRDAPNKTKARFTNLIAEPDAEEGAVVEAVNDTLKAIAASLLMEQVLAPRFEFRPKRPDNQPTEGFDYGEDGYQEDKPNIGFNGDNGKIQMEINGLVEPKSEKAQRICQDDLNEVITAFVQDKNTVERGLFDEEAVPEELTQVRMGKIIKEKYPELDVEDQEAVRQHAVAALNLIQKAKENIAGGGDETATANTALLDGIRKFAMDVKGLDIDLIDRINPFGEAYAILAKTMSEERLKRIKEVIEAKKVSMSLDEARELAKRALKFKQEKGRLPALTAADPWEKRMAEGVAFLQRVAKEAKEEQDA